MKYIWLALALVAGPAVAQDTIDVTTRYLAQDFSPLLKPQTPFLGFAGADYQRLRVVFLSVTRDATSSTTYKVSGYTLLKGRQTPFSGTITVDRIEQLKVQHFGVDDEYKGRVVVEGIFLGDYAFQEGDGSSLTGAMILSWYVDAKGRLLYDDIEINSDSYSNNQYTGRWSSPQQTVTANWGEYRIPGSGDLDIGAASFGANRKYEANGWPADEPSPK